MTSIVLSWGSVAGAATSGTINNRDKSIKVSASSAPVFTIGGGGGSVPRCQWDALTRGDVASIGGGAPGGLTVDEQSEPAVRESGGDTFRLYVVACPGEATSLRYVRDGLTAADLIPGVLDIVRARLQPPVPDVNPPPEAGGIVNLGLWLAVEPQEMTPVSAQAGPGAWITVSPVLSSTSYELGNGDRVECDGTGTPIPDWARDGLEEGPCGYTYRLSSPEDDPYRLGVTAEWALPFVSSDGGGALDPMNRSVTVDYDVDEIQTVGIAN